MTRSASDMLSLTLPGRTRARSRWKRPRKPTLLELWYLCWTTLSIAGSVLDLLEGHVIGGAYLAGCAGFWWRGYQRARKGHRFPLDLFAVAWICGLGAALIIAGVPG